jgi:S1-C subfamily serine protease
MSAPPSYHPSQPRSLSALVPLLVVLVAVLLFVQVWTLWGDYHGPPSRRLDPTAQPRPIAPAGDLAADEKATIALFKEASQSVVHITTKEVGRDIGFNEVEVEVGTGSGFVWDDKGDIVTNYHVVEHADRCQVTLADQSTWDAVRIGVAPDTDIAVLRIKAPASRLHPLLIGTSRDLEVGQKVFAIGNPFGLDQTLTTGIISGLGREIKSRTDRTIHNVIQTDAAINPGNSGGPLLDSHGRLIGVNTAIYSPSGASAGIGFAIPVDAVQRVVPQLLRHGKIVHPSLDVFFLSDSISSRLDLEGVIIAKVIPGGAADKAGLHSTRRYSNGDIALGDVIVAVDGKPVTNLDELLTAIDKHAIGDQVKLTIIRGLGTRNEENKEVTVTLGTDGDRE